MDWKKESEMFNQMADYYDKYRPCYPDEIINAIIKKANLSAGSKLLEIGSGSGKATAQFAGFGFDILCIDPGEDLVKIGNEKFKGKNIKFVVSRFEDYPAPLEYFDAIISAQAFHWVPKPQGFAKCAAALKNDGFLLPFWNIEIIGDTELDSEMNDVFNKFNAFTSACTKNDFDKRTERIISEFAESENFTKPDIIHSHWEKNYTAEEYFCYMTTGNVFVRNPDDIKQACYEELKRLAKKYNGLKRHFICELYISQKISVK